MDHPIQVRRLDLVINKKKGTCLPVDSAVPFDKNGTPISVQKTGPRSNKEEETNVFSNGLGHSS